MKKVLLTLALAAFTSLAYADDAAPPSTTSAPPGKEQMKQEREAQAAKIKAACTEEIAKTGCKEELGHGLMKCIHDFKDKNADFKVSDACKDVVKESREMRKERKMMRKQRKEERKQEKAAEPTK